MKWEDLEPGDVIKVTNKVRTRGNYTKEDWANKDLIVSKIYTKEDDYYPTHVVIWCDNNQYNFHILLNGCHMHCESLGIFFDIIKLREEC